MSTKVQEPPKDSVVLNVCILPPTHVAEEFVKMSQSLKSADTLFVLDGKSKFAHMTVFMARFPKSSIPEVLSAVQNVLATERPFACQQSGFFMTAGRYFEVSYTKTEEFMHLHDALITALKDYRSTPGEPFEESYFAPYTKEQEDNAKETGYDLAHALYRPHITLTRYREGGVPESEPEFPPAELSFNLSTVAVYKADANGAVYEQLGLFEIK